MKHHEPHFASRCARFSIALVIGATLPLAVQGQVVAPTSEIKPPPSKPMVAPSVVPSKAEATDVIELSPFQVTAEEDHGYQATSTLGGTRLRTDLKDLAVSMSVITKEFMDDLGIDSISNLANYTAGTEVAGIEGNYSSAVKNDASSFMEFSDTVRQVTPTVRVRGLATASSTRDYFLTDLPNDSYNMDRTEIQRGPNGMLYGLGSPAGVINQVMSKANLQRTKTRVATRVDNYGSYRAALDHNQVLLKDKLAVRVMSLYNRTEYQIEEAFNLDRRVYGTVTYRPFKDTTLRVNGEAGLVTGTPPQFRPPNDALTYWWAEGKPVYNGLTDSFSFLGAAPTGPGFNGNPNQFINRSQHRAPNPSLIIENPNTGVYGLSIPGHPQAAELSSNRIFRNAAGVFVNNGSIYGTSLGNVFLRTTQQLGSFTTNFWKAPMITDPQIFDFFHHELDGTSRHRDGKWGTYNLALEQRLGEHAGLEVAYDSQNYHTRYNDYIQFNRYTLSLDVTTILNDGTPNPNFGRPFSADSNFSSTTSIKREATRATAYYDFDFKRLFGDNSRLARILGRHTLTTNYTLQSSTTYTAGGNEMLDTSYYNIVQASNAGTATIASNRPNGARQVNLVTYFGPNISAASSPRGQGIQGLTVDANVNDSGLSALSLYYRPVPPVNSTVPTSYTIGNFNIIKPGEWDYSSIASGATLKGDRFRALSAVMQDRWLANTVVTTYGVRRDWVKTFDAGAPVFDNIGNLITDNQTWPLRPALDQRHDAFNYGVVLHAPNFITRRLPWGAEFGFTYNHSDNFSPQATRLNVYGQSIDPTSGTTKDYGFYISLLDRKLDLRITHYKSANTLATNESLRASIISFDRNFYSTMVAVVGGQLDVKPDGTSQLGAKQAFINFLRSPEAAPFYRPEVSGWSVNAAGNLSGTTDGTQGRVFGTSDVAAQGWEYELTANPTRSWRLSANAAKQAPVLSNTGNDLWALMESWRPQLVDGPAGDFVLQAGSPASTARGVFLLNEANTARTRALDGSISPEVRKWRFNLVTNYSFRHGILKDWGVGGSVRWQDKSAIGYPVILINGAGQYDVKHPFYGPSERSFDGWLSYGRRVWNDRVQWKAQLNVRNIGIKDKLIPVAAQPDGTIDSYRIAGNTVWTLSNSFDF